MAWEALLAEITVTIGEREHHAGILRRGESPNQTYWLRSHGTYHSFNGKGDDTVATVLGLTEFALLFGREMETTLPPSGSVRE